MKILFLSPNQRTRWNPGHQHFRDEIGKSHDVFYYGAGFWTWEDFNMQVHVPTLLNELETSHSWVPDVIMTYGLKYTWPFQGLGEVKKIPKIHFLCDFTPPCHGWPGTQVEYLQMLQRDKYNGIFVLSYQARDWFYQHQPGMNVEYLPFGVDENYFKYDRQKRMFERDFFIAWSRHDAIYPYRPKIEQVVKKMEKRHGFSHLIKRTFGEGFVDQIHKARIIPNTGNVFNTMNMKHFEVMACRGLLFTQGTRELWDLGYRDGVHCVMYTDEEDFENKAAYYLSNPAHASRVRTAGYVMTLKRNTNAHRVQEMSFLMERML